jgi:ABC-type branched-subunit amino acid transport system substrate-binding protein
MRITMLVLVLAAGLAAGQATAAGSKPRHSHLRSNASHVVVPPGQPVQLAFTADTTQGSPFAEFTASAENAIQMAVERHPTIRGFPIRVNDVESLCLGGDNTQSATAIVGNRQNTAVLGNICSAGSETALPICEAAGVVTISGSASRSDLPTFAPTVFNRTIVVSDAAGDAGDLWDERVAALPSVLAWDQEYEAEFGTAPVLSPFPALYFDAATLLLRRLQQVSRVVGGNLVIDRAQLANAVRHTTHFPGVSCAIDLDPSTGDRIDTLGTLENFGRCQFR